jgi:adenylylsulfate kinase
MPMKILIMGPQGSGKTTLAKALAPLINAVHFDISALNVAPTIMQQAKLLNILCDAVYNAGHNVIADFICPSDDSRQLFGDFCVIYMSTQKLDNTDYSFQPPAKYDYKLLDYNARNHARTFAEHFVKHR